MILALRVKRIRVMKVAVKTLDNKTAGDVNLADSVFGVVPRGDIVARVVKWQYKGYSVSTPKSPQPFDAKSWK